MAPNMHHLPLQDACWRKGFKAASNTYTILRRAKSRSSVIQVLAEVVLREGVQWGQRVWGRAASASAAFASWLLADVLLCTHNPESTVLQKDCGSACYSSHIHFHSDLQELWSQAEQFRARFCPEGCRDCLVDIKEDLSSTRDPCEAPLCAPIRDCCRSAKACEIIQLLQVPLSEYCETLSLKGVMHVSRAEN